MDLIVGEQAIGVAAEDGGAAPAIFAYVVRIVV